MSFFLNLIPISADAVGDARHNSRSNCSTQRHHPATQAAKQSLFHAGMQAVTALFNNMAAPSTDPAMHALAAKVQTTNSAADVLHTVTSDWSRWSTAHYENMAALGGQTDTLQDRVVPALMAFNKFKASRGLDALRAALLSYARGVRAQGAIILLNEQTMVKDGLESHESELDQALPALGYS
ncbi:hypothetical protein B0H66DRAFT_595724 [Apodospora peruviana]|uniref:Uncharacterized protein n=1 Tax=Apodospora peruviana TaxID=516989 RepID=A0AAE0HSH9_9PEZI|nr:hypothetical protein B0H66DRAFT_595724 [Apodospora peruviana]